MILTFLSVHSVPLVLEQIFMLLLDFMVLERLQPSKSIDTRRLSLCWLLIKSVSYVVQIVNWIREILFMRLAMRARPTRLLLSLRLTSWIASSLGRQWPRISIRSANSTDKPFLPRQDVERFIDSSRRVLKKLINQFVNSYKILKTYLKQLQITMMIANDVELANQIFLCLLQTTLQVLIHSFLFVNSDHI